MSVNLLLFTSGVYKSFLLLIEHTEISMGVCLLALFLPMSLDLMITTILKIAMLYQDLFTSATWPNVSQELHVVQLCIKFCWFAFLLVTNLVIVTFPIYYVAKMDVLDRFFSVETYCCAHLVYTQIVVSFVKYAQNLPTYAEYEIIITDDT